MSTIGQKEAVVNAVKNVLGSNYIPFSTPVKSVIASSQLEKIRDIVFNGIKNGSITYGKDLTDEKTLRRYVGGMVDNHLRKSRELNGGMVYQPVKEGMKRDMQLSTLNKLSKTYLEGSDEHAKVKEAMIYREKELKAEKNLKKKTAVTKTKNTIDTDLLSDDLAEIIGKDNF